MFVVIHKPMFEIVPVYFRLAIEFEDIYLQRFEEGMFALLSKFRMRKVGRYAIWAA